MSSYVTHLEAAIDGTRLAAGELQTMHADRPLWVRYDLPAVARAMTKAVRRNRRLSLRESCAFREDQRWLLRYFRGAKGDYGRNCL